MASFRGVLGTGLVLVSAVAGTSCSGDDGQKSEASTDGGGTSPDGAGAGGAGAGGASAGGASPSSGGLVNVPDASPDGPTTDADPDAGADAGDAAGGDATLDTGPPPPPARNCGDGTVQIDQREECDEGSAVNGTPGSACSPACRWLCIKGVRESTCSNGILCDGLEACGDDHKCLPSTGNLPQGTRCGQSHICDNGVCRLADVDCGDGLIRPPEEECEDGNAVDGDGCDSCRFTCVLGDDTRDCRPADPCEGSSKCTTFTHVCEPRTPLVDLTPCGDGSEVKKCVSGACTTRFCGNSEVDAPAEECDDGNEVNGDGCDSCRFSCVSGDSTRDCSSANDCYEDGTCSSQHVCSQPVAKATGTACGAAGNYCISGTCQPPVCGDGFKGPGEACDDGNTNDEDGCTRACAIECTDAALDCRKNGTPDAPDCRVPACVNDRCDTAPGPDGDACNTGSGSATCSAGACTAGTCGNGSPDAGEQCDLGNGNGPNTGCEVDCRLSCQVNADCTDGDPCNGAETCNQTTNRCVAGTPDADGTGCGSGRLCVGGECRRGVCGDGYWDEAGGEGCDPPNTAGCDPNCVALEVCNLDGPWALRVDAGVTWGEVGPGIQPGASTITTWARMDLTRTGTSLAVSLAPCAIVVPDFNFDFEPVIFNEWFGLTFDTNFSAVTPADTTGRLNNLSPGATVNFSPAASLVGLSMPNPFDPTWPDTIWDLIDVPGVTFPDVDRDGKPGITVSTKTGTQPASGRPYTNVPVNLNDLDNIGRADRLQLVVRQIASQAGVLDTCTTMSGNASVTSLNVHIMGCRRDTGADCTDEEISLADAARPIYTVTSSTFRAVKLSGTPTCDAVKGALP